MCSLHSSASFLTSQTIENALRETGTSGKQRFANDARDSRNISYYQLGPLEGINNALQHDNRRKQREVFSSPTLLTVKAECPKSKAALEVYERIFTAQNLRDCPQFVRTQAMKTERQIRPNLIIHHSIVLRHFVHVFPFKFCCSNLDRLSVTGQSFSMKKKARLSRGSTVFNVYRVCPYSQH